MNDYRTLDDLPLSETDKAKVLMWFAWKLWDCDNRYQPDYYGKSYDPLTVEIDHKGEVTAHSYVFNFHDGGRHHCFESLRHLEDGLISELNDLADEGYTIHPNDYAYQREVVQKSRPGGPIKYQGVEGA